MTLDRVHPETASRGLVTTRRRRTHLLGRALLYSMLAFPVAAFGRLAIESEFQRTCEQTGSVETEEVRRCND